MDTGHTIQLMILIVLACLGIFITRQKYIILQEKRKQKEPSLCFLFFSLCFFFLIMVVLFFPERFIISFPFRLIWCERMVVNDADCNRT